VITDAMADASPRATQLLVNGAVKMADTTLVMMPATMMVPNTGQPRPFTRFHERLRALRPRLPSTTSAGTAQVRRVSTMKPGITRRMKPAMMASATRITMSTTDQNRARPNR
jgi:hypothetical protein